MDEPADETAVTRLQSEAASLRTHSRRRKKGSSRPANKVSRYTNLKPTPRRRPPPTGLLHRARRLRVPRARAPRAVDVVRRRSRDRAANQMALPTTNHARRAVAQPRLAVAGLAPLPRVAHGAAGRAELRHRPRGISTVPRDVARPAAPPTKLVRAGLRQMRVRGAEEAPHDVRLARRSRAVAPVVEVARPLLCWFAPCGRWRRPPIS